MTPDKIPGFNLSLEVITGIAVIIGFLVIFQSMYTAVLERTREIGILKSMGASKTDHRERGACASARCWPLPALWWGYCGTYGVQLIMAHFFPTQTFEITRGLAAPAALIAFLGASAARSIPHGWPPAKIPSMRWRTSRAYRSGNRCLSLRRNSSRLTPSAPPRCALRRLR